MKKLTICQGIPCSGKTTWAKKQRDSHDDVIRVNRDEIRAMLHNSIYTWPNEELTIKVRNNIIKEGLAAGRWVIVDDTNLRPKVVRELRKLAGPDTLVETIFFDIDIEEAWQREKSRRRENENHIIVPYNTMLQMYCHWNNEWKNIDTNIDWTKEADREVEYNPDLPSAILCDLDGTLAHMVDRGPYDHMKCSTDLLDTNVADVLCYYKSLNLKIILLSGRDGEARCETEEWLMKHEISYDYLYMREHNDNRKDSVIKLEIFNEYIRDQFNVELVLDDRNQVVDMWRSLGLTVWQVAPGDF